MSPLIKGYQKRTLRGLLYGSSPTLTSEYIDWSQIGDEEILPGMVAFKDDTTGLISVAKQNVKPYGLFANFINGPYSEIPKDTREIAIWGGWGSSVELLGNGQSTPLSKGIDWGNLKPGHPLIADGDGKIAPFAGTIGWQIGSLVEAVSSTKIIVELTDPVLRPDPPYDNHHWNIATAIISRIQEDGYYTTLKHLLSDSDLEEIAHICSLWFATAIVWRKADSGQRWWIETIEPIDPQL